MSEELETNTMPFDQAEDIVEMFYTYTLEELLEIGEGEAVAFYALYGDQHSSRNTPVVNSSQLRDLEEGSEPAGDEDGNAKDPAVEGTAVEGTDTAQLTTTCNGPEQKLDDSADDFDKEAGS